MSTMGKVVKLVDNFDSLYSYVTNEGRTFWFRTNLDAPKYKVWDRCGYWFRGRGGVPGSWEPDE